jgi:hypothetical protein
MMMMIIIMKVRQAMYIYMPFSTIGDCKQIHKEGRVRSVVPRYINVCTCKNLARPIPF